MWQILKIKALGKVITGSTPSTLKPENFGKGYLFIKPPDLHEDRRRVFETATEISDTGALTQLNRLLPTNTPFVVCIGTIGKLGLTTRPSFTNQQINSVIVDQERHDPVFVYYLLKYSIPEVKQLNGGSASGRENVNKSTFENIEVRVPPLAIQHRIAGILSAYDELIENSQRRIKILESMARTLYREWFVHFRFPGHEQHPRVASPLGEIPQGWEVRNVSEVAYIFRGRSYRSVDLAEDGGLPFINLKCLDRDGGFRRSGIKRYTGEYKDTHVVRVGDIVMAVTDMTQDRRIVARAASIPTLDKEFGIVSMDLVRIEPKPPVPKVFLYSFLRYSSFADEVKQHANGANVLHLSPDRIADFRFAAPDTNLMEKFSEFSAPILMQIDSLENKIQNLRRTRDLLLPRLLSGQINVETSA